MERGAWWATVHGVAGLGMTERLTLVNNILLVKLTTTKTKQKGNSLQLS